MATIFTLSNREHKELVADLAARLPYGVLVRCRYVGKEVVNIQRLSYPLLHDFQMGNVDLRPYLTKPDYENDPTLKRLGEQFTKALTDEDFGEAKRLQMEVIDYCMMMHLDFRNLLQRDLALETSEEQRSAYGQQHKVMFGEYEADNGCDIDWQLPTIVRNSRGEAVKIPNKRWYFNIEELEEITL